MKSVVVIIPLHTNILNENEWKSLRQCVDVLSSFDICVIKPENLPVDNILNTFPCFKFISFSDIYFQNITAYNQLMMSELLYQSFLNYDYMLIYQSDAWVFRNELQSWIEKDYDYIGAPWMKKENHQKWYYQIYQNFVAKILRIPLKSTKLSGRTGNGGFSLRKISSHYRVCIEKKKIINQYLVNSVKSDLFNEDVFWSTENPEFKYPEYNDSLMFAWDQFPEKGFEATNGVLPFGCHGWFKTQKQLDFWKNIIQ
jgi:hypothetical protein